MMTVHIQLPAVMAPQLEGKQAGDGKLKLDRTTHISRTTPL